MVGSSFLNQLLSIKSHIKYNVIMIAKSTKALISNDYSPLQLEASTWSKTIESQGQTPFDISELLQYLKKSPLPVVLVDNTSNEEIAKSYPKFIESGISIATPNKKAFSSNLELWNQIFNYQPGNGLVYHEATVGAGLPIIGTLKDLIQTGDKVVKIEGIFSGTLSYIFNEYSTPIEGDVSFSKVVKVAKELGYTEPDPRDDLNGLDVARKVTILARIAGFEVESPTSFPVQSLIPSALESIESSAEFMEKLPDYDHEIQKLKDEAAAEKKVLRFVGKVDFPANLVSVGIEKYDFSHPFASLKGSDNVISIKTERYPNPLIVQGAGAGADVTAAGVLADVIRIAERV